MLNEFDHVGPALLEALCAACDCQPDDVARYIMYLQLANQWRGSLPRECTEYDVGGLELEVPELNNREGSDSMAVCPLESAAPVAQA